jgi:uncharacterized membrane protein YdjX (TVP38/TMEM64 family)
MLPISSLEPERSKRPGWARAVVLLLGILLVAASIYLAHSMHAGQIRIALDWVRNANASIHPFGPLGFWLLGTLVIVCNIPALVVIACAAALYGSLGAAVMGMVCLLTASLVIFALSRIFGRTFIAAHLERFLPLLERHFAARGLRTVALVRLSFFALPPTNWALAVMNIRLREYLLGTFLGAIPHVLLWAWMGATAIDMLAGQTAFSWSAPEVWGPLAAGGALTAFSLLLQRRTTHAAA